MNFLLSELILGEALQRQCQHWAAQRYACAAKGAEDACYSDAVLFEGLCDSEGLVCWTISHSSQTSLH